VIRRIFLLAIACVLLIGLSLSGCSCAGDLVVTFPDPNLDTAIREALNKPSGPIYASELAGLASLSANVSGIEDLSGLQYCTNLAYLYLESNQISDISPLANLTNVTVLYLGSNQISDISPLASLTNLAYVYLESNQISDISPLANLTNVTVLYLGSNQISDISPLVENAGLSEGDYVYLDENQLSSDSINTYIPQLRARGVTVSY
jgi:Leucine-rich repeat (LRR) protein